MNNLDQQHEELTRLENERDWLTHLQSLYGLSRSSASRLQWLTEECEKRATDLNRAEGLLAPKP